LDEPQSQTLAFVYGTTGEAIEYRHREPVARRGSILGSWSWTPRSVYWRLALYKVGGGIFKDETPPPTVSVWQQSSVRTSDRTGDSLGSNVGTARRQERPNLAAVSV